MSTLKRRTITVLTLLALALIAVAAVWMFSDAEKSYAAEDHSSDTAITVAFLNGLEQSDDRTAYILPSGNYYLPSDITTSKTIELEEGASVSLCLNGRTLSFNGSADYRYPVVRVKGASLVVSDCTGEDKGKIDGNNASGSVVYVENGEFILAGGGITGGRGSILFDPYTNAAEVDGVEGYGYGDESFYIQGGGVYAIDSDFVMSGGVIYGNGVASADARWYGETVVKYERENIYKDEPDKTPVYEGAIVEGGKHQYFSSGDIVQISRAQGGGVFIGTSYENRENENKSTFVMSGGAISNNVSYLHGAGMFVHNVDFEMRGGVIGGEKQYISAYTATGSPVTFDHGGNSAQAGLTGLGSTQGGGIYIYRGTERGDGNDIRLGGTAEISYNYATSASAMTVTEGSTVDISGSVSIAHNTATSGATISASGSSFSMSGGAIEYNRGTSHLSVTISADGVGSFNMSGGYIRNNTGGELGSSSAAGKSASTILSVTTQSASKNITLSGVVISDNEMYGSSYVNLEGGAISVKNTVITNNRALKYYNASGTLTGGSTAGLRAGKSSTLEISDCTINNNVAEGNNAGLFVRAYENGLYSVKNTTVNDNEAASYAGVYVALADANKSGGSVTLENVTVSGNVASASGAGVYAASNHYGIKTELKNVNAVNNTAGASYAGLYLGYNVTATMTGGSVSGNSAGSKGGKTAAGVSGSGAGIYLSAAGSTAAYTDNGAVLTASGVTVSGNVASNSAAGIYVGAGAVKNADGKGVAVDGAKATLTDCTVTGNTASGYFNASLAFAGGSYAGVYVGGGATKVGDAYYAHKGSLVMTGGSVSGNTGVASSGVYVAGDAKLTNVAIDNNACGMQRGYNVSTGAGNGAGGAGVYVTVDSNIPAATENFTFEMTGGSVRGNKSTGSGGGIYMTGGNNKNLTVSLDGVTVTGNSAVGYYNASDAFIASSGGGMYLTMLDGEIKNCEVSYNKSAGSGGGIYVSYSELTVTNTNVTNNSAGIYGSAESNGTGGNGGGIYAAGGYNATYDYSLDVTVTGGSVSGNTAYGNGGGVYLSGGSNALQTATLALTGTEIKNNLAAKYYSAGEVKGGSAYGGGVYVGNSAALPEAALSGCTVYGNSAAYGGGVYVGGSTAANYGAVGLTNGTKVYKNFASSQGGGVYANNYSKIALSGQNVIVDENGSGTDTLKADNAYLKATSNANAAKFVLGALSGSSHIGVTVSNPNAGGIEIAEFDAGTESYDVSVYFASDKSTCVIDKTVDLILIIKTGESEGATDPVKPDDFAPGSQENPAKTITVDVSVTDFDGGASAGGLVQGATSVYYDGDGQALEVTYIITINEGYYFGALTFNGTRYYFNAYDGYLYFTTDESGGVRCEDSPFAYSDGTLKVTVLLSADGDNSLALEVGKIDAPFSVSGTETTYTGGAVGVSVSRNSETGGSRVSGLFSFVTAQTVEYMVGGVWTASEPVDAGRYAVRVVWESTPYVGGTSYGSDIWTLVIGAQDWDESADNITVELSEDDYVYSDGAFEPEVTVKDNNVPGGALVEGVDYEVTYSNNKAAGAGVVTVTGIGNYDGSISVTFVISKAPNTLTYGGLDEYDGYKYNGNTQTVDLGGISALMGDVLYEIDGPDGASVTISSGTARFSFADAGVYTVTFYTEGDNNYASESREVRVVVAKAENSIDTSDVVIGSYTYVGTDMYLSLAGVDAVGLSSLEVTVDNGGSYNAANRTVTLRDAGTYTVKLSIAETANYTAAYAELTVTVSPMSVTRPSEDLTVFVYNGSAQTYKLAQSGYYTVSGELTRTNAGSNVIRVTLKDDSNYCWDDGTNGALSFTFTIAKADPTSYAVPSGLSATAGDALGSVELPDGWAWLEPGAKTTTKQSAYAAVFTPEDTANYNSVSHELTVKVTAATISAPDGGVNGSVSSGTGFALETEVKMYEVASDGYDFDETEMKDAAVEMISGKGGLDVAAVYEVSLVSDGQPVTVGQATAGGSITVTLEIPEELIGQDFYIVHIHNGEVVSVLSADDGYTVKGRYVSFETDELSQFAFVTERPAQASAAAIVIFAIIDAALIALVVFLLVSRRRRGARD